MTQAQPYSARRRIMIIAILSAVVWAPIAAMIMMAVAK